MMEANIMYTIGYGKRTIVDFINILQSFSIQYVIDIRSIPYSKFNISFNQAMLKNDLQKEGIIYAFFGDALGGRPKVPCCYGENGKVDYEVIKKQDFFQKGLNRLEVAYQKNLKVALMCSESKPQDCHRTKLLGIELKKRAIALQHIDEQGQLKSQQAMMELLTKGNTLNLFHTDPLFTSRKKYIHE